MVNYEIITPTKIIRSKRKTISLIIDINGEFIVRAPINCSEERIFKFIEKNQNWIVKKRQEVADNSKYKKLSCEDGEKLKILEEELTIKLYDNERVKQSDNILFLPKVNSKEKLVSYLKRVLKKFLINRVEEISQLTKLNYLSISISSAKTNWGSCSYNNRLHFTYKLALCPKWIIDYIIVHELCHTKIKNHSKLFWSLVAKFIPEYKVCNKWLKDNKTIINVI